MNRTLSLLAALTLTAPTVAAEPLSVRVTKSKEAIEFFAGDALVTRYHVGEEVAKPYFWPLNAPGGVTVSRGWPMETGLPNETKDHPHQKSAWFCHGDVIPEGIELKVRSGDKNVKGVDFWSEGNGHGTIACVEVAGVSDERGVARVQPANEC